MAENADEFPLQAWFLGAKSEHSTLWSELFDYVLQDYIHWRRNYFPEDPTILNRKERRSHELWIDNLSSELNKILNRLKADYPFYSPRYLAHMLSENSLPGVIGYFAGMLYNPNNVTHEVAPITVELELEAGRMVAKMLGYDTEKSWSHITSGGTIANLEALWAARQNQLNAVAFQAVCKKYNIKMDIETPNGEFVDINKLSAISLVTLTPDVQLGLPELFKETLSKLSSSYNLNELLQEVKFGPFSIASQGVLNVYNKLSIEPVILVSEAAHYCIKKIANLMGLGENNVINISVDEKFRMNCDILKKIINNLSANQVILAVVGILGTTEEGAVDPINEIINIRKDQEKTYNRSFWIHVDAAWGGYLRTMNIEKAPFNNNVKHAIINIPFAESITIDPHKMGYIPYPSGIINFRDKRSVVHAYQKAPYITVENDTSNPMDSSLLDHAVGPFIVEGSKPGAAAAATWLTHKTIPLNEFGHGKIIENSILNAQRLYNYIEHTGMVMKSDPSEDITINTVYIPDTNVVCYFFKFKIQDLKQQNSLNKNVYDMFSLKSSMGVHQMPYSKEFFISHTHFFPSQYPFSSIESLLDNIQVDEKAYNANGLFVLRSVLMNPWISTANENGIDYLEMFVTQLVKVGKQLYREIFNS